MAKNKTKPTAVDPLDFINQVENEARRKDALELVTLMKDVTGKPPKMWGPSIIGFGQYHYKYESGREGDMLLTGFSPRKQSLVLYMGAAALADDQLMSQLGKYKIGKACLYIKKLDDVDRKVLRKVVELAVAETRKKYPTE